MFQNSVISKTGQMWKLYAGILAMAVGSVVPAFEQSGMSWTVGTIIAVAGYLFSLVFISCPACHQRWFLRAILYAEIYGPLFRQSECPSCKKNFS
jgi:hypothetical protein